MSERTDPMKEAASNYLDACRSQFDNGVALVNALVGAAERIRAFQMEAVREAQAKYAEVSGQFTQASSVQDVMALEGAFIKDYSASVVGYWTRLAEILQQAQGEITGILDKQRSETLEQASLSAKAPASFYAAPEQLISVMQTAFDAARGANEAFVKAIAGMHPPAAKKKPAKSAAAHPRA